MDTSFFEAPHGGTNVVVPQGYTLTINYLPQTLPQSYNVAFLGSYMTGTIDQANHRIHDLREAIDCSYNMDSTQHDGNNGKFIVTIDHTKGKSYSYGENWRVNRAYQPSCTQLVSPY